MEQPINIDSNQHAADVLKRLNSFRQKKKHCDFVIKAGREEIAVHRNVVSACSDYFDAMLSHDTLESQSGIVEMKDVDPGCVSKCVDFMYTGDASVSEDNREQLMHVARMLQLTRLYDGIALFLEEKLDLTSFFCTQKLANLYNCEKLVGVCNDFALRHFGDIAQLEEFKDLDEDYIQFLVGSKDLMANEAVKCKALIEWIKHDAPSRKKFLTGMIEKLNLSKIPSSYKRFLTENEPLIHASAECLKLLMISVFGSGNVEAADVKIGRKEAIGIFDTTSRRLLSYDIDSKVYSDLQPMNGDMFGHSIGVVHEQYLYVLVKGVKFYRIQYSGPDATWEELPNRNLKGYGPAVTLEGGIYTCNSLSTYAQSMERYDLVLNKWTLLPNKNSMVAGDAVAVNEGKLFCIGGYDSTSKVLSQVQKYDPVSSTWCTDHSLNTARMCASATASESGIYVLGGTDEKGYLLSEVEYRCTRSKTWTKLTSMNVGRLNFSSVAIVGRIYAVGGDQKVSQTIEEYDPDTKQWEIIETMNGKDPASWTSVALIT